MICETVAHDDVEPLSDLDALLERAEQSMGDDPGYAVELAERAYHAGVARRDQPVVAKAAYLRAQGAALRGDLRDALELIGEAEAIYRRLGAAIEGVRVGLGRSHVLNELGRHVEALEAAQAVVEQARSLAGREAAPKVAALLGAGHQNCGLCLELMGRYVDALEHYKSATREYGRAGGAGASGLGQVRANRAGVLVQLARPVAAAREYRLAADGFAAQGDRRREASSRTRLAEVLLQLGDFTQSLQELDRTRQLLDTIDAPVERHNCSMATARWFVALGLVPEAIAQYRQATQWLDVTQQHAEIARVHLELASAERRIGDTHRAMADLEVAVAAFEAAGNVPMMAAAMVAATEMAVTGVAPNDAPHDTAALARRALTLAEASGARVTAARARAVLAACEPSGAARDRLFDTARAELAARGALVVQAELDAQHGHDMLLRDDLAGAKELLVSADTVLSQMAESVGSDSLRWRSGSLRRMVTAGLIDIAARERSVDELIGLIDRAGGAGIERLLDDQVAPGYRSEALEAAWVADALMSAAQAGNGQLVDELRRRQRELGLAASADSAASVLRPSSRTVAPAWRPARQLRSAVVRYFVSEGQVGAVILVAGFGPVLARRLAPVGTVEGWVRRLDAQFNRQRLGSRFVTEHRVALTASTMRSLRELHHLLVAPVLDRLPGKVATLAIVPTGPLWRVPFAALADEAGFLVERLAVHLAPSGGVLERCQAQPMRHGAARLAIGVDDDSIPDAEDEARAVAAAIGRCTALTGPAGKTSVLRHRPLEFVHLAAHTVMRDDNPMFSSMRLADGWLSAVDVLQLDLTGAVVVLSGCDSARAQSPLAGEPTGFVRAALGAGARSLVGALWPVADGPTRSLTAKWAHNFSRGLGAAESLRRAQLELIDLGHHPFGWAGFTVIGAP